MMKKRFAAVLSKWHGTIIDAVGIMIIVLCVILFIHSCGQ